MVVAPYMNTANWYRTIIGMRAASARQHTDSKPAQRACIAGNQCHMLRRQSCAVICAARSAVQPLVAPKGLAGQCSPAAEVQSLSARTTVPLADCSERLPALNLTRPSSLAQEPRQAGRDRQAGHGAKKKGNRARSRTDTRQHAQGCFPAAWGSTAPPAAVPPRVWQLAERAGKVSQSVHPGWPA